MGSQSPILCEAHFQDFGGESITEGTIMEWQRPGLALTHIFPVIKMGGKHQQKAPTKVGDTLSTQKRILKPTTIDTNLLRNSVNIVCIEPL